MSCATLRYSPLIVLLLAVVGCRNTTDDTPLVAKVYQHELHKSDLSGLIPEGVSPEDSVAIVKNYVEQWIRQTVLLDKAEKNIKEDFSHQLTDYKNSLLTYAYEQQIVNQLLDTNITAEQLSLYYEQHRDEFLLHNAVVRTTYVVVPLKHPALGKLKNMISKSQFSDENVVELEEVATQQGLTGYYDIETWMPFYNLQRAVPIATYNESLFLKQNASVSVSDERFTYLVRIMEYKVSNDPAPLDLVAEDIRALILNHRKLEILNTLQNDLLEEAMQSDNLKRYI